MRWIWKVVAWLSLNDQPDDLITKLIGTPVVKFKDFDPTVRERTAAKRQAADKIRARANHVESGSPVSVILKVVGK